MNFKRIAAFVLAVLMCMSLCVTVTAAGASDSEEITILITHDLHSHLLPSANETGQGEYGGYARLMTAIKE